jgi:hypothetical protein
MKITRRDFIHAGCSIFAAGLGVSVPTEVLAETEASPANFLLSKRSGINTNFVNSPEFHFIDYTKSAGFGPFGNAFANTPLGFNQLLDATGWPNHDQASGHTFGPGGFTIEDSALVPGPYVCDGLGSGNVVFGQQFGYPTFTVDLAKSKNVKINDNGNYVVTNPWRIQFMWSGVRQLLNIQVRSTNLGNGGFIRNIRFFQLADEADLNAGLMFRRKWKQAIVDYNPSCVRLMNWFGGPNLNMRFENRATPKLPTHSGTHWGASPRYGTTTGANLMTLPGVAETPGSMKHGEIVTCRIGASARGGTNNPPKVLSITNANPGIVTLQRGAADIIGRLDSGTPGIAGNTLTISAVTRGTVAVGNTIFKAGEFVGVITGGGGMVWTVNGPPKLVPKDTAMNLSPFQTGDVIQHVGLQGYLTGMAELDHVPATIKVLSDTTYSIDVDTRSFSPYPSSTITGDSTGSANGKITGVSPSDISKLSAGMWIFQPNAPSGQSIRITRVDTDSFDTVNGALPAGKGTRFIVTAASVAIEYFSLDVGGRGAFPILQGYGAPLGQASYPTSYFAAGQYVTFYFDKSISGRKDGSGNWIKGAWLTNASVNSTNGTSLPHSGGVPIEVCTALINELNAMRPKSPIHMWITLPFNSLLSMDPDYSATSNFALGTIDVILNGANGFPGLKDGIGLIVENSNETWNFAFIACDYYVSRGFQRWGAPNDNSSFSTLRSCIVVSDVKKVFRDQRIKYVLGMQGTVGVFGGNSARINGTRLLLADPLNPTPGQPPILAHDAICIAAYVRSADTPSLESCLTLWESAAGDQALEAAAYQKYVSGILNSGNETINRYFGINGFKNGLLQSYAATAQSFGKVAIMYEGGWDQAASFSSFVTTTALIATDTIAGLNAGQVAQFNVGDYIYDPVGQIPLRTTIISKPTATSIQLSSRFTAPKGGVFYRFTPTNFFLLMCERSSQFAIAFRAGFDAFQATQGAYMPNDYIQIGQPWGHNFPDTFGFNRGGIELSGMDETWKALAARNQELKH